MEKIYKKISFESLRSRIETSMNSIAYNSDTHPDNTWGNFLYDFSTNKQYRTKNLLRKYNWMLEQIRNGIKLRNKSDLNLCSSTTYSNVYVGEDNYDFLPNSGSTTGNVFNYGVFSIDDFHYENNEYVPNQSIPLQDLLPKVVLIENVDKFNEYGGSDFLKQVYGLIFVGAGGSCVPYFEIPIALVQNIADIGVMTDYEEDGILPSEIASGFSYEEVNNPIGVSWDVLGTTPLKTPLEPNDVVDEIGHKTDSKLKSLRVSDIFMDDNGNLLPGVFQIRNNKVTNGIKLYRLRYYNGRITSETEVTGRNYKCGDGMSNSECVAASTSVTPYIYRTVTILETARNMVNDSPVNGYYYFLVKYNNSPSYPMLIPYKTISDGYVYNKYDYEDENEQKHFYGDFITSITTAGTDPTIITFVYVLGGEYTINGENYVYLGGGIKYEESYLYHIGISGTTSLDDYDNITYYYNEIDYEFSQETIYNSDLMLSRSGNTTNIIEYTTGDVWREGLAVNEPVFKEEYLMGFNEGIKTDINVEINRGNAAAFEKHLKLGECNTFNDLKNYGNNYYNL